MQFTKEECDIKIDELNKDNQEDSQIISEKQKSIGERQAKIISMSAYRQAILDMEEDSLKGLNKDGVNSEDKEINIEN